LKAHVSLLKKVVDIEPANQIALKLLEKLKVAKNPGTPPPSPF